MDIITSFCILLLLAAILVLNNYLNYLTRRIDDIVIVVEKLSQATEDIYQSNLRSEQNTKKYIDDRLK